MSTQIIATLAAAGGKIYAANRYGMSLGEAGKTYLVITPESSYSSYQIQSGPVRTTSNGILIVIELAG